MKLICVGPEEPSVQIEDVWFGPNRLRTSKSGEVLWTKGSATVLRRFARTFPGSKPPQSIFTSFGDTLCACTLSNDLILVNGEKGTFWDISLPFAARKIWANPLGGFYVSRYVSKDAPETPEPVLFTISHPLDEPKPVDLPNTEEVVAVIRTLPYIITYLAAEGRYTLFKVSKEQNNNQLDSDSSAFLIDSEVRLDTVRVFSSKEWPSKVSKAFLAHSLHGTPILCVLFGSATTLVFASLDGSRIGDAHISDVLDAVPITGSTEAGLQDIVVLKMDGSLHLHRGLVRLVSLHMPIDRQLLRLQRSPSSDECFDVISSSRTRLRVAIPKRRDGPDSDIFEVILKAAKVADIAMGLAFGVDLNVYNKAADRMKTLKDMIFDILHELVRCRVTDDRIAAPTTYYEKLIRSSHHADRVRNETHWIFGGAHRQDNVQTAKNTKFKSLANTLAMQITPRKGMTAFVLDWIWASHLAIENMRLNRLESETSRKVAQFVVGLIRACFGSSSFVFRAYFDHYWREFEHFHADNLGEPEAPLAESQQSLLLPIVDIMETLMSTLKTGDFDESIWPSRSRSSTVLKVFSCIHTGNDVDALRLLCSNEAMDLNQVETLPTGVQVVIHELLYRCRSSPPVDLSKEAYALIGREDVRASLEANGNESTNEDADFFWAAWTGLGTDSSGQSKSVKHEVIDAFKHVLDSTRLRFSRDQRIREVVRLLDSSSALPLIVKRTPEMTDHDLVEAQQRKLRRQILWAMAATAGRGAFTLFTTPLSQQEKTIRVPDMAKSGRIPPQHIEIKLDESSSVLKYSWPAFHNGVAAGLSRALKAQSTIQSTQSAAARDMLRSWILFNKPKHLTDEHAGVVLALGLSRDLACLTVPDTYEYLGPRHLTTSIATLLGLACAKAGTGDANVRKTLTLHLPSLYPQEISDADLVPTIVRSSALIGLGMLYRGTCNRLMSEFFLEEISKSPQSCLTVDDRESYSLSAGLALGLVALGSGRVEGGLTGLLDLELEDKLQLLISGGPVEKLHQSYCAELGGDFGVERNSVAARQQRIGRQDRSSGHASGLDRDPKCSRVLEGSYVNTDVTSPGATLALGLIFLKSGDLSVAQRISAPSTRVLLEAIRPDFLMFRAWASALIMWDNVLPTIEWINSTIPTYLLSVTDPQEVKLHQQARAYLIAGSALGMGCCFAGTANSQACHTLRELLRLALASPLDSSVDMQVSDSAIPPGFLAHVGSFCGDTFLACLGIALGLVMAGTGDLESMKSLRALRRGAQRYGLQQMSALAIGFLFLGGGSMSFSRSDEAIASIVCSVFPLLASSPDDNSAYIQALRHLYVLAVEKRCVEAFDADTQQPAMVPLVIKLKGDVKLDEASLSSAPDLGDSVVGPSVQNEEREGDATVIRAVTPCWMPPIESVESISIGSPRYWGLSLEPKSFPLGLVVKLRADQLPYRVDLRGLSCLTARPRPRSKAELVGSLRDFASKSPFVLAFTEHVPGYFELVYECLVRDCLNILPCLVEIAAFDPSKSSPALAYQIRFLKQYYDLRTDYDTTKLVWGKLLLVERTVSGDDLKTYMQEGGLVFTKDSKRIQTSLNLCGIPQWSTLGDIQGMLSQIDPDSALELLEATSQ